MVAVGGGAGADELSLGGGGGLVAVGLISVDFVAVALISVDFVGASAGGAS